MPELANRVLQSKKKVHRHFPGKACLILRKKYSVSRDPYATRLMTLILLLMPSSTLVLRGHFAASAVALALRFIWARDYGRTTAIAVVVVVLRQRLRRKDVARKKRSRLSSAP